MTEDKYKDNFRGDHLHGCIYEYENDPQCGKYHYVGDDSGACRYHKWKHGKGD